MSKTFYIACPETKQKLWIGQGSHNNMSTFYSSEPKTMACLADFLNTHLGKSLVVVDSDDILFDQLDYTEWCRGDNEPHE